MDPQQPPASTEADVELLKLSWQKKTFWWDWSSRLVGPLIAAVAVALIGGHYPAELKPIHLETGNATFDVSQMDKSCICRNTVRKIRVANKGPEDIAGRPCTLSPTAVARTDRLELGEYYLTSVFEPRTSCARSTLLSTSSRSCAALVFSTSESIVATFLDRRHYV